MRGPLNLLTDIKGVAVGHATDLALGSGVTAVVFDRPAVASRTVLGGAPGGRETALLDPAMVVIGGGVAAAGDLLLEPARKGFADQLSARGHRPEATIVIASMGNDAGIVGAADLARL